MWNSECNGDFSGTCVGYLRGLFPMRARVFPSQFPPVGLEGS
jgi:hypothetical protein